ncbi:MAG: 2-dehydropantoate 2-reductase [Alphaproteobacteria bacterium]
MKLAVMGAGALGCYFGGRLAAAGSDIVFIARGRQLDALRRDGLRIESPLGDLHLPEVQASDDPGEVGEVDLVLFLVKLYDTEAAAKAIGPMLGPQTAVLSFQNGIDAWERIGGIVGQERVIGGTAVIPADIKAPGIVRHNGPFAKLTFGEFDGSDSARCRAFAALLDKAGVDAELVGDIEIRIWQKFIILSALSALTALTRLPLGPIRDDPVAAELVTRAIDETAKVGLAACPGLTEEAAASMHGFATKLPDSMRASMLDDLERGRRLELNDLSGAVVRLAAEHGIDVPFHETVWRALQPYAAGRPSGAATA